MDLLGQACGVDERRVNGRVRLDRLPVLVEDVPLEQKIGAVVARPAVIRAAALAVVPVQREGDDAVQTLGSDRQRNQRPGVDVEGDR